MNRERDERRYMAGLEGLHAIEAARAGSVEDAYWYARWAARFVLPWTKARADRAYWEKTSEASEVIGRRYADAVQRAVDPIEPGSNVLREVGATGFLVGRPHAYRITLWDDGRYLTEAGEVDSIALTIGRIVIARVAEGDAL